MGAGEQARAQCALQRTCCGPASGTIARARLPALGCWGWPPSIPSILSPRLWLMCLLTTT